ncbi:MAG: hypothetical protein CVU97_00010 [Firmicutes bacterium HGW-Firmicutes-21]|nr:MAG: hypothetical protein CVU97_00010 [Firmicutes bacterium HGW-Firmicutes-21]
MYNGRTAKANNLADVEKIKGREAFLMKKTGVIKSWFGIPAASPHASIATAGINQIERKRLPDKSKKQRVTGALM